MILEEAIGHLRETLEDHTHIWSCESCKEEHKQLIAWLLELQSLRAQAETEKNEPLTLDELRKMEGKPVILEVGEVSRRENLMTKWEILTGYDDDYDDDVFFFTRRMCGFSAKNYGKTWLAYRRMPEQKTRGANDAQKNQP